MVLCVLFLSSVAGFSGIKIQYVILESNKVAAVQSIVAEKDKVKISVSESNNSAESLNLMYTDGKVYLINDAEKSYMDFGAMPKDKENTSTFDKKDWSRIKKTGKKLKIASYPCKEYKYNDNEGKFRIYVSKNRKLIKALSGVAKGFSKAGVGPAIFESGPKGGVVLGISLNGQMVFKADKIKIKSIPSKVFSLKGYQKFDMGNLMQQMMQMQGSSDKQ